MNRSFNERSFTFIYIYSPCLFQYRICLFCFQLPAPVEDFDQIVILSDEEGEVSPPLPAMDPATVDIIKNALKEIQELQCLDSFWIPIVSWRWILDPYNVYFPSRSFYYIYIYMFFGTKVALAYDKCQLPPCATCTLRLAGKLDDDLPADKVQSCLVDTGVTLGFVGSFLFF